jgi:hypothetical protein
MKKLIATSLCAALLIAALTACSEDEVNPGGNGNNTTTTTNTTPNNGNGNAPNGGGNGPNVEHEFESLSEMLEAIVEEANENLEEDDVIQPFLPPLESEDAPEFNPEFVMGISEAQHNNLVVDLVHEQAAIMTIPFELILIETENSADAGTLAGLIADNYDTNKWICVFPRTVATVQIGQYALVIASNRAQSDALIAAFEEVLGGESGEVNRFHELSDEEYNELNEGGNGNGGFGFGGGADIGDIGDLGEDGLLAVE